MDDIHDYENAEYFNASSKNGSFLKVLKYFKTKFYNK